MRRGSSLILPNLILKCPPKPPLYRGSFLYGTPTMFMDILNQPDFSSYDISTMRGGGKGARVARTGLAWVS